VVAFLQTVEMAAMLAAPLALLLAVEAGLVD
jgi:hypothetical protein